MRKFENCQFRFCDDPIPDDRRIDAQYCCDEHGIAERNAKKKDNPKMLAINKAIRQNYNIVVDLSKRGKTRVPYSFLKFLDFKFDVMTSSMDFEPDGTVICEIYEYILIIKNDYCTIKKNSDYGSF